MSMFFTFGGCEQSTYMKWWQRHDKFQTAFKDWLEHSEILLCVTFFIIHKLLRHANCSPCTILSWSGEHLAKSSLQLCQLSLGSAAPGAKMFRIWVKAISWGSEKKTRRISPLWKQTGKSNLPWVIGWIYYEDWGTDMWCHILWEKALHDIQKH